MEQRRGLIPLALLAVAMFGFGFAIAPFYSLLCDAAGLQRADGGGSAARPPSGVAARPVTVRFDATVQDDLPWEFRPAVATMTVRPGEVREVLFIARNRTDRTVSGRAIATVLPWQAADYFRKGECFCYRHQTLAPGETQELRLRFFVAPELPAEVKQLTVAYTFMRQ